jgi:heme-degrading monooxygenase HmoA
MSHLRIPADRAEELIVAFRGRLGLVDDFEGFEGLEVWCSDREPGEVIMVSRWRDRDCFRNYMRSPAHAVSHGRIPPELDAAIRLERLEHLHTYDVVAT